VTHTFSTSFSPGGKFRIGVAKNNGSYVNSFVGTLTCLNIWSIYLKPVFISTMASGGMNINGDLLAWRNVPAQIVGNLVMIPITEIYGAGRIHSLRLAFL
jgi:hypothetical protein